MERKVKFISGRTNLAATVYVPYDCSNNCKFCSSKKEYSCNTNIVEVMNKLDLIANSTIPEVVFTGGEPMANLDVLKVMVSKVSNKDIYINTSFINKDWKEFCNFVNSTNAIKGINISRHASSYDKDCRILNHINEDAFISEIKKPVKINVVIPDSVLVKDFVSAVLSRWGKLVNETSIKVCFRSNFNDTTPFSLHNLNDPNIDILSDFGVFLNHSYCNVCDTINFENSEFHNLMYSYHRGLATTSILFANVVEVNDVIVFPDGEMAYDWDRKDDNFSQFLETFSLIKKSDLEIFQERIQELKKKKYEKSTLDNKIEVLSPNCNNNSSGSCGYSTVCGGNSSGFCGQHTVYDGNSHLGSSGVHTSCGGYRYNSSGTCGGYRSSSC